ncbi:MAG: RDD family protein [Candidatus Riflebacteria bacterium]
MSQDLVIITPENAEIRVPLAGMFSRAGAFVYDIGVQILWLVLFYLGLMGSFDYIRFPVHYYLSYTFIGGLMMIFSLAWSVGYYVYHEVHNHGRTPGKKAFGIRVVMANGQDVRFFSSLLRNVLKLADFLPSLFLAAFFSMAVTERHQRIGDLLADTVVIREQNV